ncbi:hypothetical protein ABIB50_003846 [Mucilaginibacter sp. UYCu711]
MNIAAHTNASHNTVKKYLSTFKAGDFTPK